MKKFLTGTLIITMLATLTACTDDTSPTKENCTIAHINEIALKQGLEKAAQLSENCIKKGYADSLQWFNEKKEDAAELGENIKDKGEELKQKGTELKDKVAEFSSQTVEKGKKLIQ